MAMLDTTMSDLAIEVADAHPINSQDVSKLLSLVFGYPGDNCSNVEFHPCGVTFITPTSSPTMKRVRLNAPRQVSA